MSRARQAALGPSVAGVIPRSVPFAVRRVFGIAFAGVCHSIAGIFEFNVPSNLLVIEVGPVHKREELEPSQLLNGLAVGETPPAPFIVPEAEPELRCVKHESPD